MYPILVSAGTTSSPAGVGPIRVQASLSEREELRRKLDGEVESANELRQKSNREIARKLVLYLLIRCHNFGQSLF